MAPFEAFKRNCVPIRVVTFYIIILRTYTAQISLFYGCSLTSFGESWITRSLSLSCSLIFGLALAIRARYNTTIRGPPGQPSSRFYARLLTKERADTFASRAPVHVAHASPRPPRLFTSFEPVFPGTRLLSGCHTCSKGR